MTLYTIRTRSKPHKFWLGRHAGLTNSRGAACRFTRKQVELIVREFPVGWFKACVVVIPVEVS